VYNGTSGHKWKQDQISFAYGLGSIRYKFTACPEEIDQEPFDFQPNFYRINYDNMMLQGKETPRPSLFQLSLKQVPVVVFPLPFCYSFLTAHI
jgi:hypothetical protein